MYKGLCHHFVVYKRANFLFCLQDESGRGDAISDAAVAELNGHRYDTSK